MTEMTWFFAVFAAAAVAALWLGRVALVRWRLARLREKPILVGAAMRLVGISPKDVDASGRSSDLLRAAERCTVCGETEACRLALAAGSRELLDRACPNRQFFQDVERHKVVCAADEACRDRGARAPEPNATILPARPLFPTQ